MKHGTILPTIQLRYLMTAPWVAILLFFILGSEFYINFRIIVRSKKGGDAK